MNGVLNMKKQIIILFAAIIEMICTCAINNDDNNSNNSEKDNTNTEENQNQGTNDENADNNAEDNEENGIENDVENESENNAGDNMDNQTNNDSSDSDSALADFPEYNTLVAEIDVDRLDAEIETDNPNTRVILYADSDGHKQYKSIFIKKQDRLKIIHFDDDGEIFNEVIK